jgi:hypothetical protein
MYFMPFTCRERERETVVGSALFGMVKRNYKDNANQKAKA